MDLYHIALFVHILALVVASSATAITKLAVGRRARARTVGEALDWHNVLSSTSKLFPLCLAAFVITGGYMLSLSHTAWSSGFVVAGLLGAVLLLLSGVFLGVKGKLLKEMLEGLAKKGAGQPVPKLVPPRLVATLPAVNTGLALSVAFDMVTKPASIPVALGVMAVGVALGAATSLRRPAAAAQGAPAVS